MNNPNHRAVLSGTGAYLPAKTLTNDDLSRMVDTSDEWIYPRTGIRSRHIAAAAENVSDMAAAAERQPDYILPSVKELHELLTIPNS